jgi:alkyl hydroperoxide reductase subunit AhpC
MAGALRLSERRHARLHDSGKIIYGHETGLRRCEYRRGRSNADDVESHKNFCNKFSFTIDLLADPNAELLSAAGVGQSDYKGTMYWNRTSYVIDPNGVLRKIYEKVNPEGHERVLLDDIKAMQAAA